MQAQDAPSSVFGGFKCMILYVPGELANFLNCWKGGTWRGDVLRCIMQRTN